jgi:tRNA pseudouridine38-40 synthase
MKHLYECSITSEQPFLYFKIRANAFLHHMVRNIVGSLLVVGQGKQKPEWIKTILQAKNRELAAPTFAPDGLYLMEVGYPKDLAIPTPHWQNAWLPKELMLSV